MKKEYKCSCCGEKIDSEKYDMKNYGWQVDGLYQCSGTCFNIEFRKRYKESKTNIYGACSNGNTRGKVIDRGYERHGSR